MPFFWPGGVETSFIQRGEVMHKRVALLGVLILVVLPLSAQASDPLSYPHMPDQLLVKFLPGTDEATVQAINGSLGGQVALRFRGDRDLRLIRLPEGSNLAEAIDFYHLQPEVDYAEPDHVYQTQLIPNDTSFNQLWGMHNTGQSGGVVDADIDAPEAWDSHTDSPGIVIASLDTGVDKNHEDLVGNIWINPGEIAGNGVDDDNNGFIDDVNGWDFIQNDNNPADDHSHGSHTMGTSAAKGNNGKGVAGVTWTASIMIVKVCNQFGSCPSSATIQGIDYSTDNAARVSSNSWGGGGFNQSMKDAIDRADQAGILFSAAAGNNSRNTDLNPFYPASYDNPNIVSVAAMDRFWNKSGFSNYGATTVDLGAPGSSIYSTTPNNGYGNKSGTSMACPHVTGAIAYIMGFNPTLPHLDYKQIILDAVEPNEAMAGRSVTGGVLNLKKALDLTPPLDIPEENDPPVADAGGPYKGRAFQPITFDGSGSFDPDEQELGDFVSTYTWDFGDGAVVTTSSPTVTHTYPFGNTDYTVTLTVKDKYRVSSTSPDTTTCRIRGGGRKPKP
jgi:subtilisin family serine protease